MKRAKSQRKGFKRGRRGLAIFLVMTLLSGILSGCAAKEPETTPTPTPMAPTGIYVPVAAIRSIDYAFVSSQYDRDYIWLGDAILYTDIEWMEDTRQRQKTLYRQSLDGVSDREIVLQEETGKEYWDVIWTDSEGNLYLLGRQLDSSNRLFYRKLNAQAEEVFTVFPLGVPDSDTNYMNSVGFTDKEGNSCIVDGNSGVILFFDEAGNLVGSDTGQVTQGSLIDAGDQGLFYWRKDGNTGEALLQPIDLQQKKLGALMTLAFTDTLEYWERYTYTLLGAGEEGLLLSSQDTLYRYDLASRTAEKMLRWNDGNVNIDGIQVVQIRGLEWTEQGNPQFQALLMESQVYGTGAEIADITFVDEAYAPEKQTVLLGTSDEFVSPGLQRAVRRFNRQSLEYRVEMVSYSTEQLTETLMYGKGEVPDLLNADVISLDLLESKGLLEDLEPYFKKSPVVGKEDILESVWNAGCVGGTMVRAVTGFSIYSLSTTAETITEPGWTAEELLALQQDYPDSRLLDYCWPSNVFGLVVSSRMDDFLDWEKREAHFDSQEFVELLETLNQLNYPEDPTLGRNQRVFYQDEETRKFLRQEWLINYEYIYNSITYWETRSTYRDRAFLVGYPSADGEPLYHMSAYLEFSIYGEAACKEGAWAFIEYLLSPEEQDWYVADNTYSGFPVRREAFDEYVERPFSRDGTLYAGARFKEEYAEELRFMAEHMVRDQWSELDMPIRTILVEETGAFFAGDKTAQETADLIQNRIQLYLDEQ